MHNLARVKVKNMSTIIRLLNAIALPLSVFSAMSYIAIAQAAPTAPQQKAIHKICSFDSVDNSLPPAVSKQNNSPLSYLQEQGFTQNADGSWVCYRNESKADESYYTVFKVQLVKGKLVATSFLNSGSLISEQDNRTLDLFTMLINNHTNTSPESRQSIRRYIDTFISLVKQGKIQPSRRAYLFDQPNRGFIIYHSLTGGTLKGTAITINIDSPQRLGSSPGF